MHHHLTSPITLRGRVLKNRIVFGAHTANMSDMGLPGPRAKAYWLDRAKGGAAMIVTEPVPAHATGVLTRGNYRPQDDAIVAGFREVTSAVKAEGCVILQQIYHIGAHGDSDLSFQPHWSPSGLPSYHDSDGSHAMTGTEVQELFDAHLAAAVRARDAGFDGVEIWAAYHSLIDQFWTPWSNTRTDRWGGSLENRTRFSRELIAAIRSACGPEFMIGLAISWQESPVLLTMDELCEIVALHDTGDVDYVTVGFGGYMDFEGIIPPFTHPEKLTTGLTARLKAVVRHMKVTSEAAIRTPDNAETILAAGEADLVSIVRGQIADPHLAAKTMAGEPERIRPCLSCNQMCWGRRSRDYWISCLINPSAGREYEWGGDRFTPATGDLLVVGAGPAGLEAARAAAERGIKVEIVEALPQIGGQFRLAGMQPRRAQILDLMDWYEREFDRLGVRLRLNTYLDAEEIAAHPAATVVIATGSLPDETGFQRWNPAGGLTGPRLWSPEAVMRREARLGETVVLYDEGSNWRGVGTSWTLAERGHKVIHVTPEPFVGREIARTSADQSARRRLAQLGVTFVTESGIAAWTGTEATLRSLLTGAETRVAASDLVMATTNRSFDPAPEGIPGKKLYRIGDAAAPRLAAYAFHEGRKLALSL